VLPTVLEQGVAILEKLLGGQARVLAPAVLAFPDHLRFGVATVAVRVRATGGVRHRSAAVEIGNVLRRYGYDRTALLTAPRGSILAYPAEWAQRLGTLAYEKTLWDHSMALGDGGDEGTT
jgi:hypothetical protein